MKILPKLKLVISFLITIFTGIVTLFLIVIVLDLAKILFSLKLLVLYFDFSSINASDINITIFTF